MNRIGILFLLFCSISIYKLNYASGNDTLTRAGIIALNVAETLLVNTNMEFLGVSNIQLHPNVSHYITHNICKAFPTFAQLLGVSTEQYVAQSSQLTHNDTHVLALFILQSLQNYMLLNSVYKNNTPKDYIRRAIECTGLTAGSCVIAWAALLTYNSLHFLTQGL